MRVRVCACVRWLGRTSVAQLVGDEFGKVNAHFLARQFHRSLGDPSVVVEEQRGEERRVERAESHQSVRAVGEHDVLAHLRAQI